MFISCEQKEGIKKGEQIALSMPDVLPGPSEPAVSDRLSSLPFNSPQDSAKIGLQPSLSYSASRSPSSETCKYGFDAPRVLEQLSGSHCPKPSATCRHGNPRSTVNSRKHSVFLPGVRDSCRHSDSSHFHSRRLNSFFHRADPNYVTYTTQQPAREGSNGWFHRTSPHDQVSDHRLLPSDEHSMSSRMVLETTPSTGTSQARSVFSRQKLRVKGQILKRKLVESAHRLGHIFSEECDGNTSCWYVPSPSEFRIPSINEVHASMARHRHLCGPGEPGVPQPPSQEELFQVAGQRGIPRETLQRWVSRGIRCWLAFHFHLSDRLPEEKFCKSIYR